MAANFWVSSHCQTWLISPSEEAASQKVLDRKSRNATILELDEIRKLRVHVAVFISNLGKHQLVRCRQRVISTATAYIARFYHHNSYRDYHPYLMGAVAIYLASKVEEFAVQPKNIVQAGLDLVKSPYKVNDIVDGEYVLMDELQFNYSEGSGASLLVFHPYRPMEQYVQDADMQDILGTAWQMINDSYRIDLVLYHPPHILAVAVILMAGSYHNKAMDQWFNGLNFKPEHKGSIKVVQEALLEMYEEFSHLDHEEINDIMDKIPPLPPLGDTGSPENYRSSLP
ncbi:cyclin-like protein [Baffinella frigidus]|nr:cyclin-like protein [Cryptophyta sp. CCMP2293]|mmetsp:Transcript_42192/g.99473  ORF Transcript_42192/g.99473 Transcript_42192/m.99473 type:complete len:284 (+) Transcript_42192:103-954(+)